MKTYKIIVALLISATTTLAGKWDLNIDVDARTRTSYRNCETYAESVCELVGAFIAAKDKEEKSFIAEQIKFMKKQLRKCEKNNKSNSSVDVKVGVGHEF